MALTTATDSGTATLGHLDKFVIAGEELVITGLGAYGDGLRVKRPPPAAVDRTYYPFTGLDPDTLAPTWGAAATVKAQIKVLGDGTTAYAGQFNADDGADMPATRRTGYLQEADAAASWPLIQIQLWDLAHGLMIPELYSGQLLPPPTVTDPGDPELSIPPTIDPADPIDLALVWVDLREQWIPEGNGRRKLGDACLTVSREGLALEQLLADGAFIGLGAAGVNAGVARRYQVTGPEGVMPLKTYHWKIYLKRVSG